ncbi:hypothetical protein [Amaricoccus macauensis]|uniref:hypothetical protein n=1 Tax=Amaricoccus macauensis TaxID=57001 RepID=UPI003C7BD9C2
MISSRIAGAFALSFTLAAGAMAEEVEITLIDPLDGDLNSYCLDISGGLGEGADPAAGLQAHTCYSYRGSLEVDQIFEADRFADGVLYMPRFDVCATLVGREAGAMIGLAACDGGDMQMIALQEDGTLRPAVAQEMCLTVGEETRMGRGGTSPHQIKSLTLEACDAELATYQAWRPRTEND